MKATVFLGGGRITSVLVAGLQVAGYDKPILVHDRHPSKLRQLRRQYGVAIESDLNRAVAQARVLVIAVRPDSVRPLLRKIGIIKRPLIAVSLAAGIPLARLRGGLGKSVGWARAMPSPVCRTGCGLTAVTFDRNLARSTRREVTDLFARVGTVLEIPESKFDAFTVTYSSSHGYHALTALSDAGRKLGLDRKSALLAAAHALADGIVSWRKGNVSLGSLLQEAATPGGIAAAVMSTMDASGYRETVARGLRAGIARAKNNAKH